MASLLSMLDRFEQAATVKRFRDMFEVLHNLDLDELVSAEIIHPIDHKSWTRFNNDLTTFVLKLDAERVEKLVALVDSKADRDKLHAARRAIMEAFEARSASAEPVAWLDRAANGSIAHVLLSERAANDFRLSGHKLEPLYTSPPASEREAELVKAARAVINSWDERRGGDAPEKRKTYSEGDLTINYWSPSASMVDSEVIANLRAVLRSSQQNI